MAFDLTAPVVPEEVISLGTLIVDLVGVFAGSVLGALQAERRKMDLMGYLVLGLSPASAAASSATRCCRRGLRWHWCGRGI